MDPQWLQVVVDNLSTPDDPFLRSLPFSHEPYYHLLHTLGEFMHNKSLAVVLGVYRATCCAHIAADSVGEVVGFDHVLTEEARLIEALYDNFHLYETSSTGAKVREVMDEYMAQGYKVAMIMFDTEHNYDQVKGEVAFMRPYINKDTVLLFDDVHAAEDEVLRAVRELGGEYLNLDQLHTALGFGAVIPV